MLVSKQSKWDWRTGCSKRSIATPDGLSADELASAAGTEAFYTGVWAKSAYGASLLELNTEGKYVLAPHMDKLLLNPEFPGYVGGIINVFKQPEMFDSFNANLPTGKRTWWDEVSPEFIQGVSGTGAPFYNRLIPGGLAQVPDLVEKLETGASVLELASGAGRGLVKLAAQYPNVSITGLDGDAHSISLAKDRVADAGLSDRVDYLQSTLEDLSEEDKYDFVFINISMHEARDIDLATKNIRNALKPGGIFVISDFPFPDGHEGLRTVPARVMSGIQYFEAQIDDQLVSTETFVKLLQDQGFSGVDSFIISPVHNVIYGTK
ncbi:MAG: class I SAM-dependent methyltransferase [Chloroflexi bacterium]|nr:class I SAM-dependent methyltransferase [Chloroflexota bacterium]